MYISNMMNKNILFSLLLFPLANITILAFNGVEIILNVSVTFLLKQIAIFIAVAISEELFFRGLLLRKLVFYFKWRPLSASLVVSLVFGLLHLFNVNSYATWGYVVIQSICAFAISFNLCTIFMNDRKLLWCIVIHAVINISSIGLDSGNGEKLILSNVESIVFLIVSTLYLYNGMKMLNNKSMEE